MGSANAARDFGFGAASARPDASSVQIGFRYFSEDTGALETVVVQSGVRSWRETTTPPLDLIVYASPTGTGSGLSESDPTNIVDGLNLFRAGFARKGELLLLPGVYAAPDTMALPAPATGANDANAFMMRGTTWTDSGLGTLTATGYVGGTGYSGWVITDTALSLAANQYRGWWIRWLTGAGAGRRSVIANSGTNTLTGAAVLSHSALPGDTYVIERPAAEIAVGPRQLTIQGQIAFGMRDMRFTGVATATVAFTRCDVWMDACAFEGQIALNIDFPGVSLRSSYFNVPREIGVVSGARRFPAYTDTVYWRYCGSYFNCEYSPNFNFRAFNEGNAFYVIGCAFYNTRITCSEGGRGMMGGCSMEATIARAVANGYLHLENCRFNGSGVGPLGVLSAWSNSYLTALLVDISNDVTATIPPIWVHEHSYAQLSQVTGTGNTAAGVYGIHCSRQSRIQISDPGTGTTLTATLGNVAVGNIAGGATYAQVLAGPTLNVTTDPLTLCTVST